MIWNTLPILWGGAFWMWTGRQGLDVSWAVLVFLSFFSFFPFYHKHWPWALLFIGSSTDLSASLLFECCPVHCIGHWMSHEGCTAWVESQGHSMMQCSARGRLYNGTSWKEPSRSKQPSQLVYKGSPLHCIIPRFNITLSSGLYCQRLWGSSSFVRRHHHHHHSSG